MNEKKKFKDTKFGLFLKEKAPKILDKVADLLPDSGALGIVKNLIDKAPELTPVDKDAAYLHIKELHEMDLKDRESARSREVEVAKTGKFDFMFSLTGMIGLGVFVFIVYAIVYLEVPNENKEIFIHLIGIAEGVVLSIFGYYFGSAVKKNIQ